MDIEPANKFLKLIPGTVRIYGNGMELLLLREYGAVFAAQGIKVPPTVIFRSEKDVAKFQSKLRSSTVEIGGYEMTLQTPAMTALQNAVEEAASLGLTISPRGQDSAARTYRETVELWSSRVEPALDHWTTNGKISTDECKRIRKLEPAAQVNEILALEREGIYFAKDLSKSIIYSVAPPGASQHLSLLAFDVAEFEQGEVRIILSRHGWFQTVISDLPHFTYLGTEESELPGRGLKRVQSHDRTFWIPDI